MSRTLVVASSCGLCGRADIAALVGHLGTLTSSLRFGESVLNVVPGAVKADQTLFAATGATHAAALFNERGDVPIVREDVGRHNAMDKVIGAALLAGTALEGHGVFLSGRASLELIVKAARAGIAVVVSVSAPTEAAVRVAGDVGITLAGFARGAGFTLYTHPERIVLDGAPPLPESAH